LTAIVKKMVPYVPRGVRVEVVAELKALIESGETRLPSLPPEQPNEQGTA
jgi:hypothetical protein